MARVSCHLPLGGVVVGFGGEVEWQPDFCFLAKIEQHHLESTNEENGAESDAHPFSSAAFSSGGWSRCKLHKISANRLDL